MNKYQEALNRIIDEYIPMHYEGKPMNQQTEDALLLQELVSKATPKKPVYREFMRNTPQHEFRESCPNCNCVFDYDALGKKHCSNCGQAIDWGKHE